MHHSRFSDDQFFFTESHEKNKDVLGGPEVIIFFCKNH